jgi:hypothetical protein
MAMAAGTTCKPGVADTLSYGSRFRGARRGVSAWAW